MNVDHCDDDALAAGVSGLLLWLERDEHGDVTTIDAGNASPGFVAIAFADGSAWEFACGDTDGAIAEAVFAAAAAKSGRLGVTRH